MMWNHAIAGLLIASAYFMGTSATPEPVLAPNAEQMAIQQGQIPVEYKTNNLAIALAGFLAVAGVLVEFAPSIQQGLRQWRQSQANKEVKALQAKLEAVERQFYQPIAVSPVFPEAAPTQPAAAPMPITPVAHRSLREQQMDADSQLQESWLIDFLFKPNGEPLHTNVAIQGPEGQGKTTLGEAVIALNSLGFAKIQEMRSQGMSLNDIVLAASGHVSAIEKYLLNPKHIASKPTWSFAPFVSTINEIPKGVEHFYDLMRERANDLGFDPDTAHHRWLVIDEHDWNNKAHAKDKYLNYVVSILKVCREVRDHLLLVGQSSLSKATGLDGSDYLQMGRIVLWTEAIKLLNSNSFIFSDREALKVKAEEFFESGERFALVIPSKRGLPFVAKLPHLPGARRAKPAKSNVVELKKSV